MDFRGKRESLLLSSRRRIRNSTYLRIEELEPRDLFSAGGLDSMFAMPDRGGRLVDQNPIGYSPAQIRHAYGFDQITFGSVQGTGAGQTIAIVDAYDDPNIFKDLDFFDNTFGLPGSASSVLTKATPEGKPQANSSWAGETALDVEWAHAIAPGAHILLVEAASNSLSDLLNAVTYAAGQNGVVAVSMSWGGAEFSSEINLDGLFTSAAGRGITYVAAAGDTPGEIWPSTSPNVLSVGGTSLPGLNAAGDYPTGNETGWGSSGGGTSAFESTPSYQTTVKGTSSTGRSNPDVAAVADVNTGLAIYDSVSYFGHSGWFEAGGTSVGAPLWAGLVAIADQGRGAAGSLDGATQTLPALYQLGIGANAAANFHDITSGTSGSNSAGVGYDKVTGLGTPIANNLVKGLVSVSGSGAALKVTSVHLAVTIPPADKAPATPNKPSLIIDPIGDSTTSTSQPIPINTNPSTVIPFYIFYSTALPATYTYGNSLSVIPSSAYVPQTAIFAPTSYSTSVFGGGTAGGFGSTSDYRRGGIGGFIPDTEGSAKPDSTGDAQKVRPQKQDMMSNPDKAPGDLMPMGSPEKDKAPPVPADKNGDPAPGDGFWELGLAADGLTQPTTDDAPMDTVSEAASLVPGLVAFFGSSWGARLIDPNAGHKRPKLVPN